MATQRSFHSAVKWAYTSNWGERAFSALFTLILAGLLGPREFGTVSIALIYISFLAMFLDQGFMTALIQRKDLEPEHLDAVFWMDQVLSLFLVGISVLFSGWWASRNHAPEVAKLIAVLSLCIPIESLAAVQIAILKREMDFRSLSIRANAAVLVSGVVGLGMAFAGFGPWALVGQQLAKDTTGLLLLWRQSTWRPRFEFSGKHLRDLTGFSVSNFMAQLAIYADLQTGSIVLGFLFGPVAVGLYRVADRVMTSVVTATTSSIQGVSLPEFSRNQENPEALRRSALSCIQLSSAVTLPALAGLAAVSGPLMATMGQKWIPAAGVLKILSLLGMLLIFAYFTGPLLQALSKPHQLAILEWARMAIGALVLIAAGFCVRNGSISQQIAGIAFARFFTGAFLVTPVFLYIFMRLCRISFRQLTVTVAPSAASAVCVVGSVTLFQYSGLFANGRPAFLLASEVVVGGVVGLAVLFSLETQLRQSVAGIVHRTLRRVAA